MVKLLKKNSKLFHETFLRQKTVYTQNSESTTTICGGIKKPSRDRDGLSRKRSAKEGAS